MPGIVITVVIRGLKKRYIARLYPIIIPNAVPMNKAAKKDIASRYKVEERLYRISGAVSKILLMINVGFENKAELIISVLEESSHKIKKKKRGMIGRRLRRILLVSIHVFLSVFIV
jgi:hypothetical protein